jgi:hypothetical protein
MFSLAILLLVSDRHRHEDDGDGDGDVRGGDQQTEQIGVNGYH